MSNLAIRGGHIITPGEQRLTSVWVAGGRVTALSDASPEEHNGDVLDATGCYVTPGLIDLQVNGGPACNLWADPTVSQLNDLRKDMLDKGVTSFLPTLITDDLVHMRKNIEFLSKQGAGDSGRWQAENTLSRMIGIHLEGPCLAPEKPGVHPPQFIKPASVELFEKIASEGVSLVTMAPEQDADGKSLEWLTGKGVKVALGHSNATFEEAEAAFASGIKLVTHLFNAMPPLHHRAPGAAGAALLDKQVTCCLIADGLHLAPSMVRLVLSIKGRQNCILVTDIAQIGTTGGGLVGSSITLDIAVRNVVNWGAASFADAIYMATFNPARAMGVQSEVGVIAPGALADLVLWDSETLDIKHVILAGCVVK